MRDTRKMTSVFKARALVLCLFVCVALTALSADARVTVEHVRDILGTGAVTWNGKIIFWGSTEATGTEPWVSDGTEAGTKILRDIYPGVGSSMDEEMRFSVTSRGVYFTASQTDGDTLWITDGTTAGTRKLRTNGVQEGFRAFPPEYGEIDGIMYFAAEDTAHGRGLWRSDGTNAGTYLVTNIDPANGGLWPYYFMPLNDALYFGTVGMGGGVPKLWKTDGTAEGTVKILDDAGPEVWYAGVDWGHYHYLVLNDVLYFCGTNSSYTGALWRTDGTTEGTYMVQDPGVSERFTMMQLPFEWNDMMIFSAVSSSLNDRIPVQSDGTSQGTRPFFDGNSYGPLTVLNDVLYLSGPGEAGWNGLYRMNNASSTPEFIRTLTINSFVVVYGNRLYMAAYAPESPYGEIWVSDGTAPGTEQVTNIAQGMGPDIHDLLLLNDRLYFFVSWPTPALYAIEDIPCRFTTQPQGGWREVGDRLQLDVEVEETVGDVRYQWTKDGHDIPDAINASYIIAHLMEEDSGTYRCRITDDSKSVYFSSPAVITVFPAGSLPVAALPGVTLLSASMVGAFLLRRRHTLRGKR